MNDINNDNITTKTVLIIFITAIVTAFATNIIDGFFQWKNYNQSQKKNATILYYDIENGIQGVAIAIAMKDQGVVKNSHSHLANSYLDYLADLQPRLNEEDVKNIMVYYRNMELLENIRQSYWSSKDPEYIKLLGEEYNGTLEVTNKSFNQMQIQKTLDVLRDRAKISDI